MVNEPPALTPDEVPSAQPTVSNCAAVEFAKLRTCMGVEVDEKVPPS
jgi:hypothetical protein